MSERGRPSEYTPEMALKVCEELAQGKSMRTVTKMEGMPAMSTLWRWMRAHEDFRLQYVKAKQEAADALAEEILDIADYTAEDYVENKKGDLVLNREAVERAKLRVDARKWLMSKMKPKVFGDKIDVTSDNKVLPQPILHVLNNDSGKEDSGA